MNKFECFCGEEFDTEEELGKHKTRGHLHTKMFGNTDRSYDK